MDNKIILQIIANSYFNSWMNIYDWFHKGQSYENTPECKKWYLKLLTEGLILQDRILTGDNRE